MPRHRASNVPDDERAGADRRANERRAPCNRFDPLFAATLVNHLAAAEAPIARTYAPPKSRRRKGMVVNLKA